MKQAEKIAQEKMKDLNAFDLKEATKIIIEEDEVTPEVKAKSAKTAMLTSRINTLLSLPMLLSMVMAQNLY